jgi:pyruvate,water dikinase
MIDLNMAEDVSRQAVGNKAFHLWMLGRNGVMVPKSYVITSDTVTGVSGIGQRGQTRGRGGALGRIVQTILLALREEGIVLVRSSSTQEDNVNRSGAGEYKSIPTYSTVKGVMAAVDVITRDRADTLEKESVPAILIQPLIMAVSSGVAFISRKRNEFRIVIESTWGLSAPILQGVVNPDRFSVNVKRRKSRDICIEQVDLGAKDLTLLAWDGRGARAPSPSDLHKYSFGKGVVADWKVLHSTDGHPFIFYKTPTAYRSLISLSREKVRALVQSCIRVCEILQTDADVEWVHSRNGLVIVQARPVTADLMYQVGQRGEGPSCLSKRTTALGGGEEPESHVEATVELRGIPASPGWCAGTVRRFATVINEAKGNPEYVINGVLVCEYITPEIVTALKGCRGIVASQGGMLSHAAILARELGIPCVTSVDSIYRYAMDGHYIEIDSYIGKVIIKEPGHGSAQNSKDDIAHKDRTSRDADPDAIALVTTSTWVLSLSDIKPQKLRYPFLRGWVMPLTIELCLEINKTGIPLVRKLVSQWDPGVLCFGVYIPDSWKPESGDIERLVEQLRAHEHSAFGCGVVCWLIEPRIFPVSVVGWNGRHAFIRRPRRVCP